MIINGLLLGLSTGIFCLSWCIPIFTPLLLISPQSRKEMWLNFLRFSLGRLLAYSIFGTLVGWLSEYLSGTVFSTLISLSVIILAVLMISYGLGLTVPHSKFCQQIKKVKLIFWAGFLTGVNICPPFLLAVVSGLKSGNPLNGFLYFFAFFIGTTFYLLPMTFLGYLSKIKVFNRIAAYSTIIVGLIFLIYGLRSI